MLTTKTPVTVEIERIDMALDFIEKKSWCKSANGSEHERIANSIRLYFNDRREILAQFIAIDLAV